MVTVCLLGVLGAVGTAAAGARTVGSAHLDGWLGGVVWYETGFGGANCRLLVVWCVCVRWW